MYNVVINSLNETEENEKFKFNVEERKTFIENSIDI